jgi:F-type H+-transporting ATPase subunit b
MRKLALAVAVIALLGVRAVAAQHRDPEPPPYGGPFGHAQAARPGLPHPPVPDTHADAADPTQGAVAHEGGNEGDHEGGHVPKWEDINWFTGMIAEREDAEPGLLWRPKGTPAPLGALIINTAVVFYLIVRVGKKPLRDALAKRKASLLRGIEEAAEMRDKARVRLAEYEEKLAHMDEEMERLRQELRDFAQRESERILGQARDKGTRLEQDASVTIEHELKAARDELLAESVRVAVGRARTLMQGQMSSVDQQRLLDDYLGVVADGNIGGLS